MLSTVSEKGQITVPKRLRDRLGIHPGDRLELVEDAGRLVVTKTAPADADPVEAVFGILSLDVSIDEAIRAMRGDPEPN
jgi:antitoxin PrlF